MTKEQIIQNFDPSQPGLADATIFGLPFSAEQSEIIIIPVPWEVTVSYGSGASEGPNAILDASFQVDLNHQEFPELWKLGMYFAEIPDSWSTNSEKYKKLAQPIIEALEAGENIETFPALLEDLHKINKVCRELHTEVKEKVLYWMNQGKKVVLAPLWQQAFRFFREKYGLHYIICKNIQMDGYGYREVILIPYMEENENTIFKTYEEAELACIKKLIEINYRTK